MLNHTKPSFLSSFLENSFDFKHHLQDFLHLDPETVETKLAAKKDEIKSSRNIFSYTSESIFRGFSPLPNYNSLLP